MLLNLLSAFYEQQHLDIYPALIYFNMTTEEKKYRGQKLNEIFMQRSAGTSGFGLVSCDCDHCYLHSCYLLSWQLKTAYDIAMGKLNFLKMENILKKTDKKITDENLRNLTVPDLVLLIPEGMPSST